jgi:transcriptional regulator with XRE-family HTH domain
MTQRETKIMLVLDTKQVRELAAAKGMSISKLLRNANLGANTLRQAEKRGGKVALDTVGRLAKVLGIDPGEIQKEVTEKK